VGGNDGKWWGAGSAGISCLVLYISDIEKGKALT
jgi:hypothetical protein